MNQDITLTRQEKKIVTLAAMGGMLEFYDFIIYGIFSIYFAHQFFPGQNQLLAVIESYVVFVLGYIARPIGGIFFSHVGDEYGRKKVLIITIILMGISSLGIGLLPTYQQIGILAPILLLTLRLIQGLALGGELPSTYVYICESMPNKHGTGFGITMTGVNSGLLLGMLINQLLNQLFSSDQLTSYGWRIPFIIGGGLCLISYKIRKTLQETRAFSQIHNKPEFPLATLFKSHLLRFISGTAITAVMSSLVVVAIVYMPTYLHEILHVDSGLISHIMPLVMIFNVVTIYITGKIANQLKPSQIFSILMLSCSITIPVSYWLIGTGQLILGLIILGILEGVAAMIVPLLVTYLFPAQIRLTGVALCYNVGFTIFGGLAPILITSSIKWGYGIFASPLILLAAIVLISSIGLVYAKRCSHKPI